MVAEQGSHDALVTTQFGARARAYLDSRVHAAGAELDRLAALLDGQKDARVLDLGCGAGHVTFAVAPRVREVVACDLSQEMLTTLAEAATARHLTNVATDRAAAESLPFAESSFDAVLSRYSAHHWRDLDRGLQEGGRVLRPGGLFAVVDTVSPGVPEFDTHLQAVELLRDPSHVRDYSFAEWQAAIVRAGLLVRAVTTFRVRLNFALWTERMQTPPEQVTAIRALQRGATAAVARRFVIGADGSFSIDVALFEGVKPAA